MQYDRANRGAYCASGDHNVQPITPPRAHVYSVTVSHYMFCQLRLALPDDLPAIVAIYNASVAGRMATADLEPVPVDDRRQWFAAHQTEACPLWVAEATQSDRKIMGWVALSDFYGRVAYAGTREIAVYVAPAAQGHGIASMLVKKAILQAKALGLHTIVAYVFSHNEPSVRLFSRCGFSRWGHCPDIARMDGKARSLDIFGLTV